MLNPRSVFRAPPVAPVQGLASRGPAAAASATGGRVPVITTDQGVTAPAIEGPTGLAALKMNTQRQDQAATATSDLIGSMQDEIAGTKNIDELLPKMLGAGIAAKNVALAGGAGDEVLMGGGDQTIGDDGRPVATKAVTPTALGMPVVPDNITKEQAKTIAMETIGLTGEEDYEDANTALMMFGLGLMATPGPLGQAIGIAGQKAMPQILQAQRAKRARRKDVGVMAYNIQEKNKAQRVAASAARRKWYNEDTSLAVDLYKIQQEETKNHLAAALGNATPGTEAAVLKHLNSKSFAKIFRNVRGMSKNPDDPAAMDKVMGSNGRSLAALAISKALESGDIDQEDIGGQGQDPGWKTYFERHPTKPGWTRRRMISSVRAKAKHPKTGVYDWIDAGTSFEVDAWAPPTPGTPAVLHNFNPKTQMWEQTSSDGLKQKAVDELNESERAVFELITTAEQATKIVDEGGAFATSKWLSATTKAASYADAIIAALPIKEQNKKGMRKAVQDFTNKYSGALNKHTLKDLRKRKGQNSLVLNGNSISSQQGINSWISSISDKTSRAKIIAGMEKKDREMATTVFNNFAALNPKLQGLMFNMAYAVGRSEEKGGRLTDRDIANALQQLGGNEAGNLASPEIFKAVLHQKVRSVATNHQRRARQYPKLTNLPEYNIVARWGVIERDLNNKPVPLPTWFLPKTSDADQPAVAQPAVAQPAVVQRAQTDRLKNTVVTSPITIGGETTSLSQAHPFFAQDTVDSSGRLRTEEQVFAAMGIPWGKTAGAEGLQEIKNRIAQQEGLAVDHPDVLAKAIRISTSFGKFLKDPDAAAQLQSVLQPPYAPVQ